MSILISGKSVSSAFAHRFYFAPQHVTVATASGLRERMFGVLAQTELASLPGFGRPGRFNVTFAQGNYTEMEIGAVVNRRNRFDLGLWFMADLWGRYGQDFRETADGRGVRGHAWLFALSTAMRYSDHEFLDQSDQFAVMHIAGPAAMLWLAPRAGMMLRIDANAHPDFAAIHSAAFEEWRPTHDVGGVKTVLQDKNYQFHVGGSARARVRFDWGPLTVGARGAFGAYQSIEGYDRLEERVTADVHGTEMAWEWGGWLGYRARRAPIGVRVAIDSFRRDSHIEDHETILWDLRFSTSMGIQF